MEHYELEVFQKIASTQADNAEATLRLAKAMERIATVLERMYPADSAAEQAKSFK